MTDHTKTAESTGEAAAGASSHHSHADDIEEQIRGYILVFAALAVLTVLTVAVAYLNLPFVLGLIVGLAIATVKGGLVAGYFMHLISEEKVIYVILAFTIVFLISMIIITSSSISVHRGAPGVP